MKKAGQRTFIARDLRANDIADLAAGGEISNYIHTHIQSVPVSPLNIYLVRREEILMDGWVASHHSNQSKRP